MKRWVHKSKQCSSKPRQAAKRQKTIEQVERRQLARIAKANLTKAWRARASLESKISNKGKRKAYSGILLAKKHYSLALPKWEHLSRSPIYPSLSLSLSLQTQKNSSHQIIASVWILPVGNLCVCSKCDCRNPTAAVVVSFLTFIPLFFCSLPFVQVHISSGGFTGPEFRTTLPWNLSKIFGWCTLSTKNPARRPSLSWISVPK